MEEERKKIKDMTIEERRAYNNEYRHRRKEMLKKYRPEIYEKIRQRERERAKRVYYEDHEHYKEIQHRYYQNVVSKRKKEETRKRREERDRIYLEIRQIPARLRTKEQQRLFLCGQARDYNNRMKKYNPEAYAEKLRKQKENTKSKKC